MQIKRHFDANLDGDAARGERLLRVGITRTAAYFDHGVGEAAFPGIQRGLNLHDGDRRADGAVEGGGHGFGFTLGGF